MINVLMKIFLLSKTLNHRQPTIQISTREMSLQKNYESLALTLFKKLFSIMIGFFLYPTIKKKLFY